MTTLMWNVVWVLAFVLALRGLLATANVLVFMLIVAATTSLAFKLIMWEFW